MFQLDSVYRDCDECCEELESIQEMEHEDLEHYGSILENEEGPGKDLNKVDFHNVENDSEYCIPDSKYQDTFHELGDGTFFILYLLSLEILLKIFVKLTKFFRTVTHLCRILKESVLMTELKRVWLV